MSLQPLLLQHGIAAVHGKIDGHACRVANLGQEGSIDAGRVNLQYWFNGPSDIPDAADPLSQFAMSCLDTTTSAIISALLTCMLPGCMRSW